MRRTQLSLELPAEYQTPPVTGTPPAPFGLTYTLAQSRAAFQEWKASCGPHAIAAIGRFTLDEVRDALGNYRGWMSPTQVEDTLTVLGVPFRRTNHLCTKALCNGLNRLQWEGPWLKPGVPEAVAYHHTHWVAHRAGWVLCTAANPACWIPLLSWFTYLEQQQPPWHVTHHYEIADVGNLVA